MLTKTFTNFLPYHSSIQSLYRLSFPTNRHLQERDRMAAHVSYYGQMCHSLYKELEVPIWTAIVETKLTLD